MSANNIGYQLTHIKTTEYLSSFQEWCEHYFKINWKLFFLINWPMMKIKKLEILEVHI